MEHARLTKKRLILFIVLTFSVSWAVFAAIPLSGQAYGGNRTAIILMGAMFVPALCSLLTRLITKEGFRNMYLRPHVRGHVRLYLAVWFGPTLFLLLSGAVYFLIFPNQFDASLIAFRTAAAGAEGFSAEGLLLISVLQVAVIGPVINILPTMGEELGWRGYLLPRLRTLLPDRAALVAAGAVWGLWHAPIIAMGHNYGAGYAGYPWLGILAMVVFCVSLGIVEGAAAIRLESAVPAAMIHSLINAGAGLPLLLARPGYNPVLGPTVAGFVGGLPFLALAAILLIRAGRETPGRPDAEN